MKVTGIVRRIDELGRIVIPKEIRKNLRIQDGESMEIVIVDDGNILLKRYMVMNKLEGLSQNFTDAIYGLVKKNVLITDIDKVIACSGKFKKEYLDKKISDELIEKIKRRESILENYFKELKTFENYTKKRWIDYNNIKNVTVKEESDIYICEVKTNSEITMKFNVRLLEGQEYQISFKVEGKWHKNGEYNNNI